MLWMVCRCRSCGVAGSEHLRPSAKLQAVSNWATSTCHHVGPPRPFLPPPYRYYVLYVCSLDCFALIQCFICDAWFIMLHFPQLLTSAESSLYFLPVHCTQQYIIQIGCLCYLCYKGGPKVGKNYQTKVLLPILIQPLQSNGYIRGGHDALFAIWESGKFQLARWNHRVASWSTFDHPSTHPSTHS